MSLLLGLGLGLFCFLWLNLLSLPGKSGSCPQLCLAAWGAFWGPRA